MQHACAEYLKTAHILGRIVAACFFYTLNFEFYVLRLILISFQENKKFVTTVDFEAKQFKFYNY